MTVGILDYGLGNIGSIKNMIHYVSDCNVLMIDNKEKVCEVDKLILPGVGKYDAGMELLEKGGFINPIYQFAMKDKKPLLGICLGMQLLGKSSEEGKKNGLGLLDFEVIHFDDEQIKVPHMGWNYVEIKNRNSALVNGICDIENRFYFVHSYYAVCHNSMDILMTSQYGREFTAAVNHDNVYGTQFHPEKSHKYGKQLLKNFLEEC